MNTRRNFLRSLALAPAGTVVLGSTRKPEPSVQIVDRVVEKVVEKEKIVNAGMPENLDAKDAECWLMVLEQRRLREEYEKRGEEFENFMVVLKPKETITAIPPAFHRASS